MVRARRRSSCRRELAAIVQGRALDPPDELEFLAWAFQHGLVGLVDQAVQEGRWHPSEQCRSAVRSARATNVLHAGLLRRELAPAAEIVATACGTAPVVIKGPVVAARLYGAPGLRAFGDLDLVVPRVSLRAAARALRARGWEPARTERAYAALGEPLPGFAEDYGHELHLLRRVGPAEAHLEAHWRIGEDPVATALDHGWLASRARPIPELDDSLLAPAPVDELLILAVHLLGHPRHTHLIWHVDLALACAALSEDEWHEAFATADSLGLGWALHRALDQVAETTGSDRRRPRKSPPPPPWGPLRAAEAMPPRLAEHAGRLAALTWRGRARYLARVALATARRMAGRRR